MLAALALTVWFFLLAGSPIPNQWVASVPWRKLYVSRTRRCARPA